MGNISAAVAEAKRSAAGGALGMDEFLWGASPLRGLSEATASQRQLHVMIQFETSSVNIFAVRPCGMEARGQAWNRTQVNPRSGRPGLGERASQREARCPTEVRTVEGAVFMQSYSSLPQEISMAPRPLSIGRGNRCGGNDASVTAMEKSDHPIVASKPGNAGRAKGVTS